MFNRKDKSKIVKNVNITLEFAKLLIVIQNIISESKGSHANDPFLKI